MKGLVLALGLLLLAFAHADVSNPPSKVADAASTEGYAHGKRPESRHPTNYREQPRYEEPGYGRGSYPQLPGSPAGDYGYYGHRLRPAPVAQKLGNPDGPWNNNGQGGLNPACIPLAPVPTGPPALDSPDFYIFVLGAASATGAFSSLFETTVNLNILATMLTAIFNAIAPFTDTAEPVWPTPGVTRRPAAERTVTNQNTATLYAARGFTKVVLPPQYDAAWAQLFGAVGLDINDASTATTTAVGIGNLAGAAALAQYRSTKWNTAGDIGYETYQRPYADWTGFIPANTAYELKHPLLWQPLLETTGLGYFQVQTHTTPQAVAVTPVLASKQYIRDARSPPPYPYGYDREAYKEQADHILDLSASLTDAQKMEAEYYDDKVTSFGVMTIAIAKAEGWKTPSEFFLADLNVQCMVDASALMWREKIRHNAVRPISAIRHIYEDSDVTAWVQNRGTQSFPGREWESYLRTMPHAEYPSGTACICATFASYMREATGTNTFPNIEPITFKAGCSRREPNLTPAQDTAISYATWDEFEYECSQTRAYAGVHFQSSIDEARKMCAPIGRQCYQRAYKLFYGASSTPGPIPSSP